MFIIPRSQQILIKELSDHLPCFMLINSQTRKPPPPKYMTIKKLTQHALLNIQNDLVEKNIYMILNKHKHKISKWITHGIIKSIKYRDKLCYLHTLVLINLTTLTILEITHIKYTLKNQIRYL